MNTILLFGLSMCLFTAYASALPYPNDVVPETLTKSESVAAVDIESEGESLIPAESARGGHGWGHGGHRGHGGGWGHGGGGWGHGGGGWGYGGGGGWGHGGHGGHRGHGWGHGR